MEQLAPATAAHRSWVHRVVMFPLTRIVLAIAIVIACVSFVSAMLALLGLEFDVAKTPVYRTFASVGKLLTAIFAYAAYVWIVERRVPREISPYHAPREFAFGALIGGTLFAITVGCLALAGCYRVVGWGELPSFVELVNVALGPAIVEELIARVILFRIVEESLGTWLATLVSGALFGLGHAGNPNATAFSSLAIALEAGLLLAAAFVLTRRLWLAAGLHFAWNATQGCVFGVAVSGTEARGLLRSTLTGPELLSGGELGAEASIFAVAVCVSAAVAGFVYAASTGAIRPPFWRRKAVAVPDVSPTGPLL